MKRICCLLLCLLLPVGALALEVGDTVRFGSYPQQDPLGEEKEPILWRVLASDGDKLLLLSETALDVRKWHYQDREITWEACTLRAWLNGYERDESHPTTNPYDDSFIGAAFTEDERALIVPALLDNPDSGRDTEDRIFLLSRGELEKLLPDAADRVCGYTTYAYACNIRENGGRCQWWLRTSGGHIYDAMYISYAGQLRTGGYMVHGKGMGVRPALYVQKEAFR